MPTELLPTRNDTPEADKTSSGFVLALVLHGLVLAGVGIAAYISHRVHPHFGDANPVAGSIQASMVNALPLPPRQLTRDHEVLTSEKPSVAPTPPPPTPEPPKAKITPVPPKAEPIPKPNEVLLPKKVVPPTKEPPKPAEREQPTPPKRQPAPPPPPTPKATTGETAGVQIPQSITQLKNGTASITVEERAFGDRYAYYVRLISQKVNQQWEQEQTNVTAAASNGKRATVTFTIEHDGTVSETHVSKKSGSATLDSAATRSIQRIDTFGPLPQGSNLTVDFSFDFRATGN